MLTSLAATNNLFKIFVYGTLKKEQPNHSLLTDTKNSVARFICHGTTDIKFPMVIATKYNLPFLLNLPGTGRNVNGEIYLIDELMLKKLDEFEEYPQIYDRTLFDVKGFDGATHQCLIYLLKTYPDDYLKKYEFLADYKNSVEQPYLESLENSCTLEDIFTS